MCSVSRTKLDKAIAYMLALGVYDKSNTNNFSNMTEVVDAVKKRSTKG